jgi:hypothetical protein
LILSRKIHNPSARVSSQAGGKNLASQKCALAKDGPQNRRQDEKEHKICAKQNSAKRGETRQGPLAA